MNAMPLSAAELCDAMRQGRAFDIGRLDRILRVDEERGLLEVQGETPWTAIAAQVRPADGRAAAVRTSMATVGRSVACNAAGPDGQPAVAHVESLILVTPEGELRRVSRQKDGELFSLAVGGQGLFGVFYSVTLRMASLLCAVARAAPPEKIHLHPGRHSPKALELLLPPEALEKFVAATDARCNDWRIALRSVELRRTAPEQETFLRWARREFVQLKLNLSAGETLGARVRSVQLRSELIDAAIAAGGSFAIASTEDATREQVKACYPQLEAFLGHKRRFDPHERLSNDWYRHQRALLAGEQCQPRWIH
jgi:hypothetical protein